MRRVQVTQIFKVNIDVPHDDDWARETELFFRSVHISSNNSSLPHDGAQYRIITIIEFFSTIKFHTDRFKTAEGRQPDFSSTGMYCKTPQRHRNRAGSLTASTNENPGGSASYKHLSWLLQCHVSDSNVDIIAVCNYHINSSTCQKY